MPSLTLADLSTRTAPMAEKKKKKWIQKAVSGAHGQFRKKAEAAGETTKEFAREHKDSGGTLGKQANLALNLMGASGAIKKPKKHKSKLYDHHAED
jgi:hypothetical protein